VIRADDQLAGYRTHEPLSAAVRVFGTPTAEHELPGFRRECEVRWARLGLTLRFFGRGCTDRSMFVSGTATGSAWQTLRKLRIGDPVSRLHALYRDAHPTAAGRGRSTWNVFRRPHAPAGRAQGTTAGLTATTTRAE
jgi:hypothetical protein